METLSVDITESRKSVIGNDGLVYVILGNECVVMDGEGDWEEGGKGGGG